MAMRASHTDTLQLFEHNLGGITLLFLEHSNVYALLKNLQGYHF